MQRTYPRKVWVLTPTFRVKEVEVVKGYRSYTGEDYGDITEAGKRYSAQEMFPTKTAAISAGRTRIAEQQAKLETMYINLDKKRTNLKKAERE